MYFQGRDSDSTALCVKNRSAFEHQHHHLLHCLEKTTVRFQTFNFPQDHQLLHLMQTELKLPLIFLNTSLKYLQQFFVFVQSLNINSVSDPRNRSWINRLTKVSFKSPFWILSVHFEIYISFSPFHPCH